MVDSTNRRRFLAASGITVVGLSGCLGSDDETDDDETEGDEEQQVDSTSNPEENDFERCIDWDGQRGAENAELDCDPGVEGFWKWILTPGGPDNIVDDDEGPVLTVTFDDEESETVIGERQGQGAAQFTVMREGGGEIVAATVCFDGGGDNPLLTISESECGEEPDADAFFDAVFVKKNDPIIEGETLEVTVEITNEGDLEGTRTIELLDFDGNVVDSQEVTLGADESTTITLTWQTEESDAGVGEITVKTNDVEITQEVEITEPPEEPVFDLEFIKKNDPIVEGEILEVTVEVTNLGTEADTQTIELLDFDGTVVDSEEVTLEGGESTTITLTWQTEENDAGEDEITVQSDDDEITQEVVIKAEEPRKKKDEKKEDKKKDKKYEK